MNAAAATAPVEPTAPATLSARFVDNRDGTVTDTTTGLTWTKLPIGDVEDGQNFANAERLCSELTLGGHADWRLPTVQELFGLVDHTRNSPAIDVNVFPETPSDWFWTSTPCAWAPSYAWVVNFSYGDVSYGHRVNYAFVRAVRSAPAGQ